MVKKGVFPAGGRTTTCFFFFFSSTKVDFVTRFLKIRVEMEKSLRLSYE